MFNFIQSLSETVGSVAIIVWIFLIILAVLWIVLPFAVFGIKNRLDKLNKNVAKIGILLKEMKSDEIETSGITQSDVDEFLDRE